MPRTPRPAIERFLEKVEQTDSCWLWAAACFTNGYGAFRDGPKQRRAHRWAYEHFVGPIPPTTVVMHTCDTPRCVNPNHLRLGTDLDNQRDMTAKGRGRTGSRNGFAKLNDDDVRAIRRLYRPGPRGGAQRKGFAPREHVAQQFGIDGKTVYAIAARRARANVPD